mmetsp:Transcript_53107/g.105476  ORF Transcript_53107/g.105476 Transcript_53107/m.105476 type:complete len:229 (+) Transcript_53107:297-983(+)
MPVRNFFAGIIGSPAASISSSTSSQSIIRSSCILSMPAASTISCDHFAKPFSTRKDWTSCKLLSLSLSPAPAVSLDTLDAAGVVTLAMSLLPRSSLGAILSETAFMPTVLLRRLHVRSGASAGNPCESGCEASAETAVAAVAVAVASGAAASVAGAAVAADAASGAPSVDARSLLSLWSPRSAPCEGCPLVEAGAVRLFDNINGDVLIYSPIVFSQIPFSAELLSYPP